jgi:hypothetical protein
MHHTSTLTRISLKSLSPKTAATAAAFLLVALFFFHTHQQEHPGILFYFPEPSPNRPLAFRLHSQVQIGSISLDARSQPLAASLEASAKLLSFLRTHALAASFVLMHWQHLPSAASSFIFLRSQRWQHLQQKKPKLHNSPSMHAWPSSANTGHAPHARTIMHVHACPSPCLHSRSCSHAFLACPCIATANRHHIVACTSPVYVSRSDHLHVHCSFSSNVPHDILDQ